jgi:hypothetical protein
MKVALVTLCLNEAEFIEKNYAQHANWPGLAAWIFVEAADHAYAAASPSMVSHHGLSIDATTEILDRLSTCDERVTVIHHGWMRHTDPAQGKCEGRNRYMEIADEVRPDMFIVIDQDEFYSREDQLRINELVDLDREHRCFRLHQRHIWRPPSIAHEPLFRHEVVGGYWSVEHVRVFRWCPGLRYTKNHNWPELPGYAPTKRMFKSPFSGPQCVHLGFARSPRERMATNRYYEHRGEGKEQHGINRQMYVNCRSSWESWSPGDDLPHGARVIEYRGESIPEVHQ